ncbi:MAG: hypothetical protein ABR510_01100 [Trueperaceae bacterium]
MERVADLRAVDHAAMLALMDAHFRGVTDERFAADLADKDLAVVLRAGDALVGFSTLARIDASVGGRPVTAFYSGDTIVRADARGSAALARAWSRHVFADAAAARRDDPERRVVWLLISSGYKTYRFLPTFFRRYLPTASGPPDPGDAALAAHLARLRYGERYHAATGVVRLAHPTPLRDGVADVSAARAADPHVAFFVAANPGHADGDELVCLTDVHEANVTPAGRRMLGLPAAPDRDRA